MFSFGRDRERSCPSSHELVVAALVGGPSTFARSQHRPTLATRSRPRRGGSGAWCVAPPRSRVSSEPERTKHGPPSIRDPRRPGGRPEGRTARPPRRRRASRRRAGHAPRGAPRVELRVPRPLLALGGRLRRPPPRARGARARAPRDGAERSRRRPSPRDRARPRGGDRSRLRYEVPRSAHRPRALEPGLVRRRGPEQATLDLLDPEGRRASLLSCGGPPPRPLRRVRLRPRVPVRADPPQPAPKPSAARPRPLPPRRARGDRPPAGDGVAPVVRFRRGEPRYRWLASRGTGAAVRLREGSFCVARPRAGRIQRGRADRPGGVQARRPLRGRRESDLLRALRAPAFGALPPAFGPQPRSLRDPHEPRRRRVPRG